MGKENRVSNFLQRGEFRAADELPLKEINGITKKLVKIQKSLDIQMNTMMTMFRDGRTGRTLGFDLVNTNPHGIDCKHNNRDLYLEVKSIDWNNDRGLSTNINLTNTNEDKAQAFSDRKLFLGISVWGDVDDLMFIIIGQDKRISQEMEKKYLEQQQTGKPACYKPTLHKLIHTYGFKVIAVNREVEDVTEMIDPAHKENQEWLNNTIIDIRDFYIEEMAESSSKDLCDSDFAWFHTGDFISTTTLTFTKLYIEMSKLSRLQKKYNLKRTDTLFNIYHDSITGQLLGFDTMNIGGGGADCKMNDDSMFLEVKSIQWNELGLTTSVNFTDTTLDKAEAFRDDRLYIGISVWKNVNELMFMVVGQNRALGENMISSLKEGESKCFRIALSTLIKKYGFKIVPITITKEELIRKVQETNMKAFSDISLEECFIKLEDLNLEECRSEKSNIADMSDCVRTDMKKISRKEMTKLRNVLSKDEAAMYELLYELSRQHGGVINISTREIAKIVDYGKSKVQKVINKMVENGLLKREYIYGSKAAVYSVIDIESVMLAA